MHRDSGFRQAQVQIAISLSTKRENSTFTLLGVVRIRNTAWRASVSIPGATERITRNWVVENNRKLFSHSSRGQETKIEGSAGPPCLPRLSGRITPRLSQLLVAPGQPWFAAASLPSLLRFSYCLLFSGVTLCVFYEGTRHWT